MSEESKTHPERGAVPDGYNAGYAEQLYERSLREAGIVPPALTEWLENGGAVAPGAAGRSRLTHPGRLAGTGDPTLVLPAEPEGAPARETADTAWLHAAAIAGELVAAYRDHGHLLVPLDPLGTPRRGHPRLDPAFYGVTDEELAGVPAAALNLEHLGETALDVIRSLHKVYCERLGYELDQLEDSAQLEWFLEYVERGEHWVPLSSRQQIALLERLSEVEGLERFLHRSYLGKKRFSIEGLDMLVPMLDELLERAAARGTREVFIGMAHRGRLNVIGHTVGRPYTAIIGEFEGEHSIGIQTTVPESGSGDVKYHYGAYGTYDTEAGPLNILLAPNPSHLEHVNPVVEGMARASQDLRYGAHRTAERGPLLADRDLDEGLDPVMADRLRVLPLLIHGDASFMGQGVVAETLNMCRLSGYDTGGTVHIIANNQLGFTTNPRDTRSTRYASDLALGFRLPVVHVNADDPEACLAAMRLAAAYRSAFGEDIVIDLVGYRRYGHNEADEPGYTQPTMYRKIADHPSVRTLWRDRLVSEGVLSETDAAAIADRVAAELEAARQRVLSDEEHQADDGSRDVEASRAPEPAEPARGAASLWAELTEDEPSETETIVATDTLLELNQKLHAWPDDFELFQKLDRQLDKRRSDVDVGLDWAHAEALAFASLVTEGVAIRLSGEDAERGTFSQRHLVLHDVRDDGIYIPLQHVAPDQAPFHVWNSPLSEVSTLGFEYGYSAIAADALVLWEAQFGDFVNVGQAIVDQFIAPARSKWGQESRLVLLLPHGYEGQGPEHSSARLERFLQLAAENNMRVANPTTPAQYFHLLRLQALRPARRPLIVMTPKSLLRSPAARSTLQDLATGRFEPVLSDEGAGDRDETVESLCLCSGKVYYDLVKSPALEERSDRVRIGRVELLYPFPEPEIAALIARYPNLGEIVWAQEEPANMGAWSFVRPHLTELSGSRRLRYVGAGPKASTAEGYAEKQAENQARLVREAFESPA